MPGAKAQGLRNQAAIQARFPPPTIAEDRDKEEWENLANPGFLDSMCQVSVTNLKPKALPPSSGTFQHIQTLCGNMLR